MSGSVRSDSKTKSLCPFLNLTCVNGQREKSACVHQEIEMCVWGWVVREYVCVGVGGA